MVDVDMVNVDMFKPTLDIVRQGSGKNAWDRSA
jgi:hypothetical protein